METITIKDKLKSFFLEFELEKILELIEEINQLKKDKNVVVLGHNYMSPEVFFGVSDFFGDSLFLSKKAKETNADIILFNGVHFMAETAKILSPDKKVLIADLNAGCSLAESITKEDVLKLKQQFPGVPVVTYINCSAEVKSETDVCCTSANAFKVIESIPSDTVIFLPDEYLAANVQLKSKKKIISHPGKCMVHELYTAQDILDVQKSFDGDVTVISHPECSTDVVKNSDYSGSTSQMMDFISRSNSKNIFLMTECSMGDNLRSEFPEKNFISSCKTCPHMKKITLEKIRDALKFEQFEIHLNKEIILKARNSLERMLEYI